MMGGHRLFETLSWLWVCAVFAAYLWQFRDLLPSILKILGWA